MDHIANNLFSVRTVLLTRQISHWGWMTRICVGKLTIIGSYNGLSARSHYLNQCWYIIDWTPGNKIRWKLDRKWYFFIQENAFENVIWELLTFQIALWDTCRIELGVSHHRKSSLFFEFRNLLWWKSKCHHSWVPKTAILANPEYAVPGPGQLFPRVIVSMMTSSNEIIFRVTGPLCVTSLVNGEPPSERPVTRSFDSFFDMRLNKRLSKQSRRAVISDAITLILMSL